MSRGGASTSAVLVPTLSMGGTLGRSDGIKSYLSTGVVAAIGVAAGAGLVLLWHRSSSRWQRERFRLGHERQHSKLSWGSREGSNSMPEKKKKPVPKRLILIRHGESEGNIDRDIYRTVADHALHLTETGWKEAMQAGKELRNIIGGERVKFFVSPYVRTRETFHAIAKAWGGHEHLLWKEDPRIREQDYGNFQDPPQMRARHAERKEFGFFYYRFLGGESCADVYDRASSFMESLYRHWREHPEIENYVVVCHGLTIAAFLMRFFKYSVDEFHVYEHFTNCEFIVLERDQRDNMQFKCVVRNDENGKPQQFAERARKPSSEHKPRQMREF